MNTDAMPPSEPGKQRPNVGKKYKNLYRLLAKSAHLTLANKKLAHLEGAAKFEELKQNLDAIWAVLTAGPPDGIIKWPDLLQQIVAYNAAPMSWVERGVTRQGTNQDFFVAERAFFTKTLAAHLPQDCDLVLDLGCGWGHRMFDLWCNGGPADAFYFGGDRSRFSDEIMAQIRPLFPAMKTAGFIFDFLDPDFEALHGEPRKIGIYSCHAIEQVFRLGSVLFDRLVARFPNAEITGVHLEPVGFQMIGKENPRWREFGPEREYAANQFYNADLIEQIQRHPKLRLITAEPRIFAYGNENTTSLAVWTRV